MSEYCEVKTEFRSEPALVAALSEVGGWTADQIERHAEPVPLVGYDKDIRPESAHVIVRKGLLGAASNDIGFKRGADGRYSIIIGDYDNGTGAYKNCSGTYGARWQAKVTQSYAFHAIRLQQERRGRTVTRLSLPNGRILVEVLHR